MEEAVFLIASIQGWVYALLVLAGVVYLRLGLKWHSAVRSARFGLEREHANARRARALAMLALVVAAAGATFALSTFLVPGIASPESPIQVPTISLLESSSLEATAAQSPDSAGCQNGEATIETPTSGEEMRGVVEVTGTANISSFAFYKIEIRQSGPGAIWQVITAGTEPVVDDTLGLWDTSLVQNGVYLLQLVVTDTEGNAPLPCTVELVVLPPGG